MEAARSCSKLREEGRQLWLGMTALGDLARVEELLRKSVKAGEMGLGDRHTEMQQSMDALCLMLCQAGATGEAAALMRRLGCVVRLSPAVLAYPPPPTGVPTSCDGGRAAKRLRSTTSTLGPSTPGPNVGGSGLCCVLDGVLPPSVLAQLQRCFCPDDADYWAAHR